MRTAILRLPVSRTANQRRQVLRTAIRQLERAGVYVEAVMYMNLDDRVGQRAVSRLHTDLESVRRYLSELRAGIRE